MTLNKFNKFSLKSENLVVDYFEFKFDALSSFCRNKSSRFNHFYVLYNLYQLLIQEITSPNYTSMRLRIAFCILTVTGIRVNEVLPLKVEQLKTLVESYWIEIDRSKRGPASHKAFLRAEGRRLVNERKKDFELFFLMKEYNLYIFTSESNHSKMLSR